MKYFLLILLFTLSACSTMKKVSPDEYRALCYDHKQDKFTYQDKIEVKKGNDTFSFSSIKEPKNCIFESKTQYKPIDEPNQNHIVFVCYFDPNYEIVIGGQDYTLVEDQTNYIQILSNVTLNRTILAKNYCQFMNSDDKQN